MDKGIFREKSIERVSSPEQLDRYVKAGSRGYLVVLLAIIVLLSGTILWASMGSLETKVDIGCCVTDGTAYCLLSEKDGSRLSRANTAVRIQGQEYPQPEITGPVLTGSTGVDQRLIRSMDMDEDDWCYLLTFPTELADGIYRCEAVLDKVSPIKLIFN